jgi:hypothetical protein
MTRQITIIPNYNFLNLFIPPYMPISNFSLHQQVWSTKNTGRRRLEYRKRWILFYLFFQIWTFFYTSYLFAITTSKHSINSYLGAINVKKGQKRLRKYSNDFNQKLMGLFYSKGIGNIRFIRKMEYPILRIFSTSSVSQVSVLFSFNQWNSL